MASNQVPAELMGCRDSDIDFDEDVPKELVEIDTAAEEAPPQEPTAPEPTVMDQLAIFLSEQRATSAEMLRAVPAEKVLERCGTHLWSQKRSTSQKAELFEHSKPVTSIDEFWSHSWHGRQHWKVWCLLYVKNAWPALFVSTATAALVALLFAFELLPGWVKTSNYAPPEPHAYGAWGCWTGVLTYLSMIILWKPRADVFVDLFCIHQADPRLKAEGLLSIGAILKNSESMLLLWDDTYLKRLWCVFELAGFLRSHQAQGRLVIKPTILGPATFWNVIAITFVVSTDLVFSGIPGGSVTRFLLVFITTCAVAWPILVWRRGMVTLKRQLAEFTFAKTVCHCCMRGHIDDNGGPIECDRELLGTSICNWFGSVDEFDNLVRSDVEAELKKQLAVSPFGYTWVLHAGVPILWAQGFDKAAAIFRHGDVLWSLAIFISGLAWYFLVIPINFGTLELFAARMDRLALGWGCRSTALLLICQCCVYLSSHLSYYACFETLPTPLLAVLVHSACAVLVFVLVWNCKKC